MTKKNKHADFLRETKEKIKLADFLRKTEDDFFTDNAGCYKKSIQIGQWDSFNDFKLYFDLHYKPLLKELVYCNNRTISEVVHDMDDKKTRLLTFFFSDMLEAFSGLDEDEEDEATDNEN